MFGCNELTIFFIVGGAVILYDFDISWFCSRRDIALRCSRRDTRSAVLPKGYRSAVFSQGNCKRFVWWWHVCTTETKQQRYCHNILCYIFHYFYGCSWIWIIFNLHGTLYFWFYDCRNSMFDLAGIELCFVWPK